MSLLTYDQVAEELAVSTRTVRRLVSGQQLLVVEILGARRVRREDLDAFVDAATARRDVVGLPGAGRRPRHVSSFRRELGAVS